jgi:CheY-like chemotaxis protein
MLIGVVIVCIVAFIVLDLLLRMLLQKFKDLKTKRAREEALDIGLKLDYKDEALSLKRIDVKDAQAKILAVDDEEIILDSFRKILTIHGYAVDTVTSGQEALGLIQKNDYDFVFTDLKMPEMDGLDVVKGVKHFRPDIDVIMITGFATIESAVDSMKFGAMDYVQKPFTEDELLSFVNKSLIRRQDKIEKSKKPQVQLLTPSVGHSASLKEVFVPVGVFVSPNHTWINIELNGSVRLGLDDFAHKILGAIKKVDLPKLGQEVKKGDPLFKLSQGAEVLTFTAPISGKVIAVNQELEDYTDLIKKKPYEFGWICDFETSNLSQELASLKIGIDTSNWYQEEIDKYLTIMSKHAGADTKENSANGKKAKEKMEGLWGELEKSFFVM